MTRTRRSGFQSPRGCHGQLSAIEPTTHNCRAPGGTDDFRQSLAVGRLRRFEDHAGDAGHEWRLRCTCNRKIVYVGRHSGHLTRVGNNRHACLLALTLAPHQLVRSRELLLRVTFGKPDARCEHRLSIF